MDQHLKMMGYEIPGDEKVPVPVRDWNGLKLGLWRTKTALEIAAREADTILSQCAHLDGCPGAQIETEPCISPTYDAEGKTVQLGCPDREIRMSALVILNAARQLAPVDPRRVAKEPYFAPSREYFSEVLSTLAATLAELEAMKAKFGEQEAPRIGSAPALKEAST
jgi:hypothetical protein